MVAYLDASYRLAQRYHDSRAFVSRYERHPHRPITARGVQVAVTHTCGFHFDEHFSTPRRTKLQRFYREWAALLADDCGPDLHCTIVGCNARACGGAAC
jgi:hypothetical protein